MSLNRLLNFVFCQSRFLVSREGLYQTNSRGGGVPVRCFSAVMTPGKELEIQYLTGDNEGVGRLADQKVAIITGGTSGIGLATSKNLAAQSFNLILGYLNDEENAKKSKADLESSFNNKVHTIKGDISKEETVNAYFECLRAEFNGQLTAIIHVAGLYTPDSMSKDPDTNFTTFECYDYYQDIYPKCFIRLVETGIKHMKDGQGYIVNVSSPGCNMTDHVRLGYMMPGTAKTVTEYLSRHYAKKLAKQQITCNCVVPGYIYTKPWKPILDVAGSEFGAKNTPMGRWGQPKDVGDLIGFLCSPRASFLTGAVIPIDGGLSLGQI